MAPRYFPNGQRIFHTAHFKQELTGQNVVPLVLTVMDMSRRSCLRARNQLKQRARTGAVVVGNLAGRAASQFGNSIGEAVLARLCDNDFAGCHRLCRQQGRDRSDTKGLERSTTTQNRLDTFQEVLWSTSGSGTLCESVYD